MPETIVAMVVTKCFFFLILLFPLRLLVGIPMLRKHLFVCLFIYLYQYRVMDSYFTPGFINHYYFIIYFDAQLSQTWPVRGPPD